MLLSRLRLSGNEKLPENFQPDFVTPISGSPLFHDKYCRRQTPQMEICFGLMTDEATAAARDSSLETMFLYFTPGSLFQNRIGIVIQK
jgi:hypothetical protein